MTQSRSGYSAAQPGPKRGGPAVPRAPCPRRAALNRPTATQCSASRTRVCIAFASESMRDSSMSIRLCVLILFITTVCQGAAAPLGLDCFTDRNSDCIECICKSESSIQNCTSGPCTGNILPERRRRQVEDAPANVVEAQPVVATSTETVVAAQPANATSNQPVAPTSTEAQLQAEVSTTSTAPTSASPSIPTLPPPPHPSSVQATAVKSRSCKSGSTWEEECNTCWCLDNGMAACTVKRCEIVSPLGGAQTTKPVPTAAPSTPEDSPSPTTSVSEKVSIETSTVLSSTSSVPSSTSSVPSSTTSVSSSTTSVSSSTTSVSSSTTSSVGTS